MTVVRKHPVPTGLFGISCLAVHQHDRKGHVGGNIVAKAEKPLEAGIPDHGPELLFVCPAHGLEELEPVKRE